MNEAPRKLLIVEDDHTQAAVLGEYLRREGYDVAVETRGREAMLALGRLKPAAVVLDLHLPDVGGIDVLRYAQECMPQMPVVVMTSDNSLGVALDAMLAGAYDFIVKPFPSARLKVTLAKALEHKTLASEVAKLRRVTGMERFYNFTGRSTVMQAVYRIIDSVAPSDVSVFITGEAGTGKEMAARAVHAAGPRRNGIFVPFDCAAVAPDMMESALFGHRKGAFPGAKGDLSGAAKLAGGGTLFLNEVCAMPVELQVRLLRFAQTGEFMPTGGSQPETVDVRFICASSRDPRTEMREQRFREDLFYRLHVVPLDMPPLRDREDDVLLLASYFLARFGGEEGKMFSGLSPEAMQAFRRYDWPGNVRQLENVMRNIAVLNDGPVITEAMLPRDMQRFMGESITPANQNRNDLVLEDGMVPGIKPLWLVEKEAIDRAMDAAHGDLKEAAVLLEISPPTLYRKLQAWKGSGIVPSAPSGAGR